MNAEEHVQEAQRLLASAEEDTRRPNTKRGLGLLEFERDLLARAQTHALVAMAMVAADVVE